MIVKVGTHLLLNFPALAAPNAFSFSFCPTEFPATPRWPPTAPPDLGEVWELDRDVGGVRDCPRDERAEPVGGGLAPLGIFGFGMRLPRLLSEDVSRTGAGAELIDRLGVLPYDLALL